jgi:hypothetical protein
MPILPLNAGPARVDPISDISKVSPYLIGKFSQILNRESGQGVSCRWNSSGDCKRSSEVPEHPHGLAMAAGAQVDAWAGAGSGQIQAEAGGEQVEEKSVGVMSDDGRLTVVWG